jgi:hypothetical protein
MMIITGAPAGSSSVSAGTDLFKMTRVAKSVLSAGLAGLAMSLLTLTAPAAAPVVLSAGSPLCFEPAGGPAPGPASFVARGHDYQFLISATEAQIALRNVRGEAAAARMQFVGASPRARIQGEAELPGRINYLTGNDPARWRVGVGTFARVAVGELYPGVSLVYYGNQQLLEYDFVIAPGTHPEVIALRFEGAKKIAISPQGELVVSLPGGEIRQPRPVMYQTQGGARKQIAGGYRLLDARTAAFAVGQYDAGRPLIIDPVLNYSGYFGGTSGETAWAVALGADGSVYIAGQTFSQKFFTNGWAGGPAFSTYGAFQTNYHGGKYTGDAFVAKLDISSGNTTVKYLTYLGGSTDDGATSLAVDAAGHVYLTGFTDSTNFPTTTNALYQNIGGSYGATFRSYPVDAFVAELNSSGSNLVYSTYLGGSGMDSGQGIAVDPAGAAYITGVTYSSNFPTAYALQRKLACTNSIYFNANAFIAKIGPGGSPLVYSTYFGGTNFDRGQSIARDTNGFVYVAGYTASTNFPTTNYVYQLINSNLVSGHFLNRSTNKTSSADAFVAKFDPTGTNLVYSTLLGSTNNDVAMSIAVDPTGAAYVTGWTVSSNFPNTLGTNVFGLRSYVATNTSNNKPATNVFLTKITNGTQAGIEWSAMFGGKGVDVGNGVALSPAGEAFVTGSASSTNFPPFNVPGYMLPTNSGKSDAFVIGFNTNATALLYATYLGGKENDYGYGIAVDANGDACVVGQTFSTNFPYFNGSLTNRNGTNDAFLTRIVTRPTPPVITARAGTNWEVYVGRTLGMSVTAIGTPILSYQWQRDGTNVLGTNDASGGGISGTTNSLLTFFFPWPMTSDSGTYTVIITNYAGAVTSAPYYLVVTNIPPTLYLQPTNQTVQGGSPVTFAVFAGGTGPLYYQWQTNGVDLPNGGRIRGATNDTLTITNAQQADSATYSVTVTGPGGSLTSSNAILWVTNYPPVIVTQPTNRTLEARATFTLSVAASGTAPLTYQWQTNGVNLPEGGRIHGATNATLTVTNAQTTDSGNYTVIVSNFGGSATSSNAIVTVTNFPPAIVLQPTNQTVAPNQTVQFVVSAVGGTPLSYRWRTNGVNLINGTRISGATTNVLTFSSVQTNDSANFTVIVSNYAGSVTSAAAALLVTAKPVITLQPTNQTVEPGQTVSLVVAAVGTSPLRYRWRMDGTNLANGGQVSGATNNLLVISNVQLTNTGSYSVVITNSAGSVTSSIAALTVTNYPPVISVQPTNRLVESGTNVTLAVVASGTLPLSYQWWMDETNLLSGATNSILTITNAQVTNSGIYAVVVANIAGSVTSSNALLTVTNFPPVIVLQPTNRTVNQGITVNFAVTVTGTAPLHFQWQTNGVDLANGGRIGGATNATLVITNAQIADSGTNYLVIITNIAGAVTSSAASLTVLAAPAILVQPTNQGAIAGATVHFIVTAVGATPLHYQWQKDGLNLGNGGAISGATTNALTISNAQLGYSGIYTVIITNAFGSVTSSNAVLTVTNAPPVIIGQPTNQSAAVGETVILAVTATGTAPLSYQWWLDETNAVPGATTNVLVISNAQTTNSGSYSVVITNLLGSATSSNAIVTVTNIPPTITLQPTNQTVFVGANVAFITGGSGTPPFFFQWQKDGTNLAEGGRILGATNYALNITGAQADDAGSYQIVVTNYGGSATSDVAVLTVVMSLGFQGITAAEGGSFVLSGGGGTSNGTYFVLTTSNLLVPRSSWTTIATNQFDPSGNFIFTNIAPTNTPQLFYLLQSP